MTAPVYFAHDARILKSFAPRVPPMEEALHLQCDRASEQGEKKLSINSFLVEGGQEKVKE